MASSAALDESTAKGPSRLTEITSPSLSFLAIERELRDATGSKLYSGTSEIQRTIIAPLLSV